MLRTIKYLFGLALLLAGAQTMWGFALGGPGIGGGTLGDSWEVPAIGYGLAGDVVTPKNLGEGYRRNTPVLYYSFADNFSGNSSGTFGASGVTAINAAMAIMNSVSNVDLYSPTLTEVPLNTMRMNYTAQALGLTDLKSETLGLLMEQMGLAEPERYTWTLHDRYLPSGGKCPVDMLYLVVQRNFDPVPSSLNQIQYSSYVNDTLYTYLIEEFCTPPDPVSVTDPFSTDPFVKNYTAVAALGAGLGVDNVQEVTNGASIFVGEWDAPEVGGYFTGLTRDDIGGLRYLLSTNTVEYEDPAAGSLMWSVVTNFNEQDSFPPSGTNFFTSTTNGYYYYNGTQGYGDLTAFLEDASTNPPSVLESNYPGVIVSSSTNIEVLEYQQVISAYFTNSLIYGEPILKVVTNYVPYLQPIYYDTFANVFTNHYYSSSSVSYLQTTTIGPIIGGAYAAGIHTNQGPLQAMVNYNIPSGDFFVLSLFNTNGCPLDILRTGYTTVIATTNVIPAVTNINTIVVNNGGTVTSNSTTVTTSQSVITFFTNYVYVVNPVTCGTVTNATDEYQGIGHVQFVPLPTEEVDPLTGNLYSQFIFTNYYTMVAYTNNQYVTRYFERIVTTPDILFSARDMAGGGSQALPVYPFGERNVNFDSGAALPGLAGPGTINPSSTITFDKVGDIYGNGSTALFNLTTNGFLSEINQFGLLAWGSFDGTTNQPVVYPNGTSITNVINQLIISVSPTPAAGIPDGTNNVAYPGVTFTGTGGTSPYTWSASGLPPGMSIPPGSNVLSGTPSVPVGISLPAIYSVTIQLNDAAGRVVDFSYSLTIH